MSILPNENERTQAQVRIGIRQATRLLQQTASVLIARAMGQDNEEGRKKAQAFVEGPFGVASLQALASVGLPLVGDHLGEEYKNKLAFLGSELKISAMTEGGDALAEVVAGPARAMLFDMLSGGELRRILDSMPEPKAQLGGTGKAPIDAEFHEENAPAATKLSRGGVFYGTLPLSLSGVHHASHL